MAERAMCARCRAIRDHSDMAEISTPGPHGTWIHRWYCHPAGVDLVVTCYDLASGGGWKIESGEYPKDPYPDD